MSIGAVQEPAITMSSGNLAVQPPTINSKSNVVSPIISVSGNQTITPDIIF